MNTVDRDEFFLKKISDVYNVDTKRIWKKLKKGVDKINEMWYTEYS